MKDEVADIEKFLGEHHLSPEYYDFNETCMNFLKEMENGLDKGSSLKMIPTFIEETGSLPPGKPVLVLDAGGTNFRAAIVTFNKGKRPEISNFRKRGMPGVEKELNRDQFFGEIADFIQDLVPEIDRIGFCFSYPMEKKPDKDGRLISFSKEIKAREVEGQVIGRGIIEALKDRGLSSIKKIVLLNDTVATLLAGKASERAEHYSDFIGLIVGTGINTSYNEKNDNIKKLPNLPGGGEQIVNMETGGYSQMAYGDIDKDFWLSTAVPEHYHYEKMISGLYLGPLCLFVLKKAARKGLFSPSFSKEINGTEKFSTACLSAFLKNPAVLIPGTSSLDGSDSAAAHTILSTVIKRAAFLTAAGIAAIVIKSGKGKNPDKPVCVCADGTTFWKLTGFKELVEGYLDEYFEKKKLYYNFIGIDNAPVIGAAVAGLTN